MTTANGWLDWYCWSRVLWKAENCNNMYPRLIYMYPLHSSVTRIYKFSTATLYSSNGNSTDYDTLTTSLRLFTNPRYIPLTGSRLHRNSFSISISLQPFMWDTLFKWYLWVCILSTLFFFTLTLYLRIYVDLIYGVSCFFVLCHFLCLFLFQFHFVSVNNTVFNVIIEVKRHLSHLHVSYFNWRH